MVTEGSPPRPPRGLKTAGRRLWNDVQAKYELEEHESALLLEMCRTADRLEALNAIVAGDGVLDEGSGRVHPAAVEARQPGIAFARLSAALRLPAGDEGDQQAGARRPQRRSGARGVYPAVRSGLRRAGSGRRRRG
jgi:hypothetical protein